MHAGVDSGEKMDSYMKSRIEDQAIIKFNDRFGDSSKIGPISKEQMFEILVNWARFWINERPVSKLPSEVIRIKQHVCDLRILFIVEKARTWKLDENLKSIFKNDYNFA
jgi:hypothetical protein